PDAQLRALQLLAEPEADEYQRILEALVARLEDYGDPLLPAGQRRFLMRQLSEVAPGCPEFPTLEAEVLAADYLDYRQSNPLPGDRGHLHPSGLDDVWEFALPDKPLAVVALFNEERIFREMESLIETGLAVPDATVKLLPRDAGPPEDASFLAGPAGEYLPDWQLALWLDDPDPFAASADSRSAMYLYSGVVVVLAMVALAGLVARSVGRQIRVTRLRNDLIATVSHELKTPLSSIRALIDTLLEGRYHDEKQHREYLQLAARENERLSRLIDNFLAFSRMERNKQTFELAEVEVEKVVAAAVSAVGEKFDACGGRLEVDVAAGLPKITGDADALTTVLVDLLDNAHKYTPGEKRVILRASAEGNKVRLEVEDNGVGLSRRAAKKVFDRFYQVDQSLARQTGGCGLGLSIVQFIVTAHGGSVTKPFSTKELLARAEAFLRRRRQKEPEVYRFGRCELHMGSRTLVRDGLEVPLTPKEFSLLALFARHPGRALTRDEILRSVWGDHLLVTTRSVDRFINTLRNKIEPNPKRATLIKTIRNIGYRFEAAEQTSRSSTVSRT
ncbi:MAG: winged helix-turn-helix domain-containing protein, partial [Planctomycetota bacterium]